jgi:hypothetical protein
MTLQERIDALGDIGLLIDKLFQDNAQSLVDSDSWNPCAFCASHIETSFGWEFENLAKPTIDDLEDIKANL